MAMVVKNNMSAISTLNTLNKNSASLSKSLGKVSSGQRINSAADDASGYAISERMRVQVRSLDQDNRNTQSGSSMMKVAEGAVSSTVDILKTLKEKVLSAANDDKTDSDRATIQKELDQSIDQINDNANVTFNGKYLVDGSHNSKVVDGGTTTALTNQYLQEGTTGKDSFSSMKDRNGNSLNINDTDTVTISFVKQGKTYSASVTADKSLEDLLKEANRVAGGNASSAKAATSVEKALESYKAAEKNATSLGLTAANVLGAGAAPTTDGANYADFTTKIAADSATTGSQKHADYYNNVYNEKKDAVDSATKLVESTQKDVDLASEALTNASAALDTDRQAYNNWHGNTDGFVTNTAATVLTTKVSTYNSKVAAASTDGGNSDVQGFIKALEATTNKADAERVKGQWNEYAFSNGTSTTLAAVADAYIAMKETEALVNASNDNKTLTEAGTDLVKAQSALAQAQSDLGAATSDFSSTVKADKANADAALAWNQAAADLANAYAAKVAADSQSTTSGNVAKSTDAFNINHIEHDDYIGTDAAGNDVRTADGKDGITIHAANSGADEQISGVTISVTNNQGGINKSANAVLDNFSESIRAENASADNAIVLQVGAKANQAIKVGLTDMRAEALGLRSNQGENIQIGTREQANAAITVLDNAIQKALDQQTTIGSVESRLEYTSSNLTTASENVQASESTIRDADMAKEMTEYTKNNVLLQAAQSMLAQANQNSSAVLSLLQ